VILERFEKFLYFGVFTIFITTSLTNLCIDSSLVSGISDPTSYFIETLITVSMFF